MRRFLLAALALAACSSDPAPPVDAGQDVGADLGTDTGPVDTGIDVPRDTGTDQGLPIDDPPVTDTGPVADTGGDVSSEPGDDASLPADSDTADAADAPDAVDAPEVGIACPMGLGDCDGVEANGCEVDLRNNPAHCGGCGAVCRGGPNATTACRSGMCGETRCNPGRSDCNNDLADGCEINITADVNNCGVCGRVCTSADGGRAVCMGGSCRSV